jgi:hypothetical protein
MNLNKDDDKHKNKYLKYKSKYLALKNQYAGLMHIINSEIEGCKIKYFDNPYYTYFDSSMIEKKHNSGKMTIKLLPEKTKVIGSGGFGRILLVTPSSESGLEQFIIKLIYKQKNCSEASKEFDNIVKVFEAFDDFTKLVNTTETPDAIEFRTNLTHLNPLKTYGYYNCDVEYNKEVYNCCIITSYSQGYNVESVIIPNLADLYNEEDKRVLKDNYQNILIMPIFPDFKINKINIDTRSNNTHLSDNDPIRYAKLQIDQFGNLGIIKESDYFDKYGKIMGMLQAILLWNAKITTTDFEILAGPKGDSYCYNLIDYGMLEQFEIKQPFDSDATIIDIVNKITVMGGVFDAKPTFPSELGVTFSNFIEYFKRASKLIHPELSDEFFVKFNSKLKEALYMSI